MMLFCEIHFHEKIVAYSEQNDQLLCAQCLSQQQYATNKSSYELIEDTFEQMKKKKILQKKQCSSLQQDLNCKLYDLQKTRSDLKSEIERTNSQINSFFTHVKESIERQRINMSEYMKQIITNQETKLNNQEKLNLQNVKVIQDILTQIEKYDQNVYHTLSNQKKFQAMIDKVSSDIQKDLISTFNIPDIDYSKIFSQIQQDSSEILQRLSIPANGNNHASNTIPTDNNASPIQNTSNSMTSTFIITAASNNLGNELKNFNETQNNFVDQQVNYTHNNPNKYINNFKNDSTKYNNTYHSLSKQKTLGRTSSVGNIGQQNQIIGTQGQQKNSQKNIYQADKVIDITIQKNFTTGLNSHSQKKIIQNNDSQVFTFINNNSLVNTILIDKENEDLVELDNIPQQINSNCSLIATSNIYSTAKKQIGTPSDKKQLSNKVVLQENTINRYNNMNKIVAVTQNTPQYSKSKSIITEQTAKQQILSNQISKKIHNLSLNKQTCLLDKIALNYSQLYKHSMSNSSAFSGNANNNSSLIKMEDSSIKKSARSISTHDANQTHLHTNHSNLITENIQEGNNKSKQQYSSSSLQQIQGREKKQNANSENELQYKYEDQQQQTDQQYVKISDQIKKHYSEQNQGDNLKNYQFVPHNQAKNNRKNASANTSPYEKRGSTIASPSTNKVQTYRQIVQSARTSPKNNSGNSKPPTHQAPHTLNQNKQTISPNQQKNNPLFQRTNYNKPQEFSQTCQFTIQDNIKKSSSNSNIQPNPPTDTTKRQTMTQYNSQSATNLLQNQQQLSSQRTERNSSQNLNQAQQFKNKFVNATRSSRSLSQESLINKTKNNDLYGYKLNKINLSKKNENNNNRQNINNIQNINSFLNNPINCLNSNSQIQNNNSQIQTNSFQNNQNSLLNQQNSLSNVKNMTFQENNYNNNESLGIVNQKQSIIQNLSKREFYDLKQDIMVVSNDIQYNYEIIPQTCNRNKKSHQLKPTNPQIQQIFNEIEGYNVISFNDNSLYLFNGVMNKSGRTPNNFIYKIDLINQVIEEKIDYSPSAARYEGCAIRMKDQILICGGRDIKDVVLDNVEILKINKNSYHNLAITRMNQNRYSFSLVKITNMLYIAVGGRTGPKNSPCNTCEALTITATQAIWNRFSPLQKSRYALQTIFLNNKLFAIGGVNNDAKILNCIEVCDLQHYLQSNQNGNNQQLPQWQLVECRLQIPRHSFGLVIQNNEAIIIGGVSYNDDCIETEASVEVFDTEQLQTFYILNTQYQRKNVFAFVV